MREKKPKEKLKPCPFCGEKPEAYWDFTPTGFEDLPEGYNILCCSTHVCALKKSDSIGKWNTRV